MMPSESPRRSGHAYRPIVPPPAPRTAAPGQTQRRRGTLRMWDDDKGFGFVEPDDGGAGVFLHIKALLNRSVRPAIGAAVTYRLGMDDQRRPKALEATLDSSVRAASGGRFRRAATSFWANSAALAASWAAVFLAGLSLAAWRGPLPDWVPVHYLVVSSITFAAYAWDKMSAKDGSWRTRESTLHLLELLGGWPGALVAQHWLRHKNRKLSYQFVFWLIAVSHLAVWTWLALGRPPIF